MSGMPIFEVMFQVDPPRVFGLPEVGYMVVPAGSNPIMHFNIQEGKAWAEREGGGEPHRRVDERLQGQFGLNQIAFRVEDNHFFALLSAPNASAAVASAQEELTRLLGVLWMSFEAPGMSFSARPIRVIADGRLLEPPPEMTGGLYPYDNQQLGSEILRAATLLDGIAKDQRLSLALSYLALGDELLSLNGFWADDDQQQRLFPLQFLQFWKALAAIVGDPTKDRDHQSRPQRLGLGRQFFKHQVAPLNDLRNNFGVAHVADLDAPKLVSAKDVAKCRATAVEVVLAYIRSKRKLGIASG